MKSALIASAFAATLLTFGVAQAAETSSQAQPAQQTQQVAQVQLKAQSGAIAVAPQTTNVAPAYEVPGRTNRAGSIYFGQ